MRQSQQPRVHYNSATVDIADIGAQVNDTYHAARNRRIYAYAPTLRTGAGGIKQAGCPCAYLSICVSIRESCVCL